MRELLKKFCSPPTGRDSYFISFEGIEGAGKSTQVKHFASWLTIEGFQATVFREPGGTLFGEKLREAVLQQKSRLHPLAEACLFASARSQLLYEKILPLLQQERQVVILDRYIDSSIAYQGVARALGVETVLKLHSFLPLTYLPHLTFYLRILPEVSEERQLKRANSKDYFEREGKAFYQGLYHGMEECVRLFPDRVHAIASESDEESVFKKIKDEWKKYVERGAT
ncbi:MAG: dTMP kinase [Oligoflexia bacterium]|nr:dTMP kinase [Oligoflexia bacterium]MBF0365264.1 dTMP kinase [Oligoflexia bacterium]